MAHESQAKIAKFKSSISVNLQPKDYIEVSATFVDEKGESWSTETRWLPFLVLDVDEDLDLVVQANDGQRSSRTLEYKCVLAIVLPGNVSYYQFSDPLVRKQYASNLLSVCTHGIENIPVREWKGGAEDAERYRNDVLNLDRMAKRYKQDKAPPQEE